MNRKNFLSVSAVILALFGLGMVLMPENMAKNFGLEINDLSRVLFRDLGTTLLGVAAINWLARDVRDFGALRAVLLGNFILQVLGTIVNIADIGQGYMGSSGWFGVILHAVLAGGFGYFYSQLSLEKANKN